MMSDLPKYFSYATLPQRNAPGIFFDLLDHKISEERTLFVITWPKNVPGILFPSALSVDTLLEAAVLKLQIMVQKETAFDYYQRKLTLANNGREISAKGFITQFSQRPRETLDALKKTGEAYYFWSQLCSFAKQDLEKVKDLSQEDISKLQAVYIIEYVAAFYKSKAQAAMQRENAIRGLDQALEKPPYYFNYDSIVKFVDSKGIPLVGQYTEEELVEYLRAQTTNALDNELPKLLIFRLDTGMRYYIAKNNVLPLIGRLLDDAHETIKQQIIISWEKALLRFVRLPEMQHQNDFEATVKKALKTNSVILYTLFQASFLYLVYQEEKSLVTLAHAFFHNDKLVSYSEILSLSQAELLAEVKTNAPFWYTTPPFSWIFKLLFGPKDKGEKHQIEAEADPYMEQIETAPEPQDYPTRRKDEIRTTAQRLLAMYVPAGSTIERELKVCEQQWNKLLNETARQNLTDDINLLIRDYLKTVLNTLKGGTIDAERVHSLSATLVRVPSLKKITEHEPLILYVELYIIRLLNNIK
jgi:hypothetical protein